MSELCSRDAAVFLHQTGSTPLEHTFHRVEGIWAEDDSGHRFMDFHGNTCHNIGYRHPRLMQALKDQLDVLPFAPRKFTNEPAVQLAELLCELWPYGEAMVLLGLSGADAVEMALKLAYITTGRRNSLAFEDSWHGAALGAVWVGGRPSERMGFPEFSGCHHVPPFWPRSKGISEEEAAQASLDAIRQYLRHGDFACFLAEPIRSTPHIPPKWFWPLVQEECNHHGTLLIFDEIPTGLGKTGQLFSSLHFEVTPDLTVLGKSLGGAAMPLSAVIARKDLNTAGHLAIGHYTHQKNPLISRAGLETLQIIANENLVSQSAVKGTRTLAKLQALVGSSPAFQSARGKGLLMAIEPSHPSELEDIRTECFKLGLHTGTAEGKFLTLSPPLTISDEELHQAMEILTVVGDRFSK